jgi:hypothetical protein
MDCCRVKEEEGPTNYSIYRKGRDEYGRKQQLPAGIKTRKKMLSSFHGKGRVSLPSGAG